MVKPSCAPKEKLGELSSAVGCGGSPIQPFSIETVTKFRVTMGKKLNSGMDGGETVENVSRER